MPWWAVWIGWVVAVVSGAANLFQFVRTLIRGAVWDERLRSLRSIKNDVELLPATVQNAIDNKTIIETDAARTWAQSVKHHAQGIEAQIDSLTSTVH